MKIRPVGFNILEHLQQVAVVVYTRTSRMRIRTTMVGLRTAFHENFALQCGFCTPGILVSLCSFLQSHTEPEPPEESEVRLRLSGNLCRCTGYQAIVSAALQAARCESGRADP